MLAAMRGVPHENWVMGWGFVVCSVSAYCYVRTLKARARPRPLQANEGEIVVAIRRALLLGVLWSLPPLMFLLDGEGPGHLTLFCLLCGMMGGGAFFLSSIPGAAVAFFSPVLLASIFAALHIDETDQWSFVALFGVFGAALASMSYRHAGQMIASLDKMIEEQRRSGRDPLTGLANRDMFARELSVAFQRLTRFGEKFALLHLHVDCGETQTAANDDIVVALAGRLSRLVEQTDVVGIFGPCEFGVILSGVGCAEEAAAIAERLSKALSLPLQLNDREYSLQWTAGLALAPKNGASVVELMRAAARASVSARDTAGADMRFCDAADGDLVEDRRQIAADLRNAIAQRQMYLEFQPICDVRSGRISSCEALVRWNHPVRGAVSPDIFIPIAERTGLIHEIGEWIVEEACRVLSNMPEDMHMAVNISAAQLRGDSVLSTLMHALAGSGVANDRIDIEVTESLLIARDDPALKVIAQLAEAGFSITLDDFGTGYASLNYLGRLPLKRVKIDREFTREMMIDERHTAIVNAILQLSKALGLEVTAEGVETRAQYEILRAIGCDSMQGYLLSRPVSEQELLALVTRREPLMAAA